VNAKAVQFHAIPLDMALWTWSHTRDPEARERCYEAIALMARAGANFEPDQWRDAIGDRSVMLEKIASVPRMQAALAARCRGEAMTGASRPCLIRDAAQPPQSYRLETK
jgi:hypothetical protein